MKKNLIVLFTILFMLMASPPLTSLAYAHGGGWGPSICIGGFFGALFGWILGTQTPRPVVVVQPPPPPPMCQREVPGHWERRWNPQGFYERMWVPRYVESFPCSASSPQLLPPPPPPPLNAPPAPYDPSPVAPPPPSPGLTPPPSVVAPLPSQGYKEPPPTTQEPGTGNISPPPTTSQITPNPNQKRCQKWAPTGEFHNESRWNPQIQTMETVSVPSFAWQDIPCE